MQQCMLPIYENSWIAKLIVKNISKSIERFIKYYFWGFLVKKWYTCRNVHLVLDDTYLWISFSSKWRREINVTPLCLADVLCCLVKLGSQIKSIHLVIHHYFEREWKEERQNRETTTFYCKLAVKTILFARTCIWNMNVIGLPVSKHHREPNTITIRLILRCSKNFEQLKEAVWNDYNEHNYRYRVF